MKIPHADSYAARKTVTSAPVRPVKGGFMQGTRRAECDRPMAARQVADPIAQRAGDKLANFFTTTLSCIFGGLVAAMSRSSLGEKPGKRI